MESQRNSEDFERSTKVIDMQSTARKRNFNDCEPSTSAEPPRKKSSIDPACTYCSAYKKVKLNSEGLCEVCNNQLICSVCGFRRKAHLYKGGKDSCSICTQKPNYLPGRSSVRNIFEEHLLPSDPNSVDVRNLIQGLENIVSSNLEQRLTDNGPVKWYIALEVKFGRENPDGSAKSTTAYFRTQPAIMMNQFETQQHLEEGKSRLDSLVDTFTNDGSGWTINEIGNVTLHTADYDAIGGSQYIQSPKWLALKTATLNIRNEDNNCFLYCILAVSHHQTSHPDRVSKYAPYLNELNIQGLTLPVKIDQIPIFEANNPDFSINVMCTNSDEDKTFVPLYASSHRNRKHVVNLLLLSEGEKRHYILIRNLSRLLHDRNSYKRQILPCPFCLYCFTTEAGMQNHIPECGTHGVQNVRYPTPGSNTLKFSNIQNQMAVPFAIYADFECFLGKSDIDAGNSTKFCDTHTPSGFCCLTVSSFTEYNNERPYVCGDGNVMDKFFMHLKSEQVRINQILSKNEPMEILNKSQIETYTNCKICPSCECDLSQENKVRHHCHVTGQFISALCTNCNLLYKFKRRSIGKNEWNYVIPVVFHNLKGYDSHVIFKHLTRFFAPKDVNVIATNMEKYLAFEIEGLRFVDSLQFLNCGLDTLVKNLTKDGNSKFEHMRRLYPNDEQFKLLLRKGVYPYEYMDCAERMNETALPAQNEFFSHLTDEHISSQDYSHAQEVWTKFDMQRMHNYHDLYLETE